MVVVLEGVVEGGERVGHMGMGWRGRWRCWRGGRRTFRALWGSKWEVLVWVMGHLEGGRRLQRSRGLWGCAVLAWLVIVLYST